MGISDIADFIPRIIKRDTMYGKFSTKSPKRLYPIKAPKKDETDNFIGNAAVIATPKGESTFNILTFEAKNEKIEVNRYFMFSEAGDSFSFVIDMLFIIQRPFFLFNIIIRNDF